MVNENKLLKEILDNGKNFNNEFDFNEKKYKFLEVCKVFLMIENFEFLDVLLEMKGIFIKCCGSEFFFVYDFMFEIVVYYFGCWFIGFMLFYMSSNYIVNYIKVEIYNVEKIENENKKLCNGNVDIKVNGI